MWEVWLGPIAELEILPAVRIAHALTQFLSFHKPPVRLAAEMKPVDIFGFNTHPD